MADESQRVHRVVIFNDDCHTYNYVVHVLVNVFGLKPEEAVQRATEIDKSGRASFAAADLAEAERLRDNVLNMGADLLLLHSHGSLIVAIESEIGGEKEISRCRWKINGILEETDVEKLPELTPKMLSAGIAESEKVRDRDINLMLLALYVLGIVLMIVMLLVHFLRERNA